MYTATSGLCLGYLGSGLFVPISSVTGKVVRFDDVINLFKFCFQYFKGFRSTGGEGQNFCFFFPLTAGVLPVMM